MNCDTSPALPEGYRFVRRRGAGTFRSPERPAFANSGIGAALRAAEYKSMQDVKHFLCTAREKKVFARYAGAAAGIGVQAIRCGTFLHRSYNWTKGKSKNRWFLAAFFSIFLSLLKEIWPPEAYMQDAGAARNRRTENGPSGTPAPTGCATGDMTRYVWAGCAHWGVQTRDAGAGGVFRWTVIDRCGPSGRRI